MLENQVALTIEEREFCKVAGDQRTDANAGRNDIPDYDSTRFNLTSRQANRIAVFAEAVAFKALGGNVLDHSLLDWAHFVPNNHPNRYDLLRRADLFGTIEVRRANSLNSPIPIRAKDRTSGAFVMQVYVPYKKKLAVSPLEPNIMVVPLHGLILGWANVDDEGWVPEWAKQKGTVVVNRRTLETFPKGWKS